MLETNTTERPQQSGNKPSAAMYEWVRQALGVEAVAPPPAAPRAATQPTERGPLVALQQSRLVWDSLRKTVQSQLQSLEKAIHDAIDAHNADAAAEDEFDAAEVSLRTKTLYTMLDHLDTRLTDALDEALNASGDARLKHQAAARDVIKEYQAFVATDPTVASVDANGFIPTTIRPTVEKTLAALAQRL